MVRVNDRRQEAEKWKADGKFLTPYAQEYNRKQDLLSNQCEVQQCDGHCFYVIYTAALLRVRRSVDLQAKTCSCLQWQQHELPCCHAIAAGRAAGRLNDMGTWYRTTMSPIYLVDGYLAAYNNKRVLLPTLEALEPDGTTLPAAFIKTAGRPKKKRIRSRGESALLGQPPTKRHKCSRCGVLGHHAVTCTKAPTW